MMHSQLVVCAVGQDGARTQRLQSKRILKATSQSPCLFIIAASFNNCHRPIRPRSRRPRYPSVSLSPCSPLVGLALAALAPRSRPSSWPPRRPPGSTLSNASLTLRSSRCSRRPRLRRGFLPLARPSEVSLLLLPRRRVLFSRGIRGGVMVMGRQQAGCQWCLPPI